MFINFPERVRVLLVAVVALGTIAGVALLAFTVFSILRVVPKTRRHMESGSICGKKLDAASKWVRWITTPIILVSLVAASAIAHVITRYPTIAYDITANFPMGEDGLNWISAIIIPLLYVATIGLGLCLLFFAYKGLMPYFRKVDEKAKEKRLAVQTASDTELEVDAVDATPKIDIIEDESW